MPAFKDEHVLVSQSVGIPPQIKLLAVNTVAFSHIFWLSTIEDCIADSLLC